MQIEFCFGGKIQFGRGWIESNGIDVSYKHTRPWFVCSFVTLKNVHPPPFTFSFGFPGHQKRKMMRRCIKPVARAARAQARSFSSKDGAPTTVTYEKMASDPRYKAGIEIDIAEDFEGDRFSINGAAIEDVRPSYLDMQATTPLDPRVLDAMLPHMMVRRTSTAGPPSLFVCPMPLLTLPFSPPRPLSKPTGKLRESSLPHPLLRLVL